VDLVGWSGELTLDAGFDALYERLYSEQFKPVLMYVIMRSGRTATYQEAEDATQEAMIRIARPAHWQRSAPNRAGWLRKVAWRVYLRDAKRERTMPGLPEADEPYEPYEDHADLVVSGLEVERILNGLPPRQRMIMRRIAEGLAPIEVALLLGMRPDTVRSNMAAVRRKFTARDDPGGPADSPRTPGAEGTGS
jgi:RNA polymerase sigma factor (sigma-70 family)